MTSDTNIFTAKPDFPDWLSPMLVKELRQGMRSRVFLISFLTVQAAMIFLGLLGLLNSATDSSTESVSVFFWIITGAPILLIMPFSGLNAISREKTANTLELIFLTKLTARRIVFGKWVAIVAQTLLLASAILPYAVMRYYIGGVDITSELAVLAWMLAGSALLTSITVGLSPFMGRVGRAVIPFAIFFLLYVGGFTISTSGIFMVWGRWDWRFDVALGLQALCLVLLMLEVGAGKIAPAAENHSTPRRLIALTSILTALVYSWAPGAGSIPIVWVPVIFIAGPILIGTVCEPVREVPSIYRPFLRLGVAGRALGSLLYPGWPSGVLFSLILLLIAVMRTDQLTSTALHLSSSTGTTWHLSSNGAHHRSAVVSSVPSDRDLLLIRITEIASLGAFFLPVALLRLIRLKIPFPGVLYFVTQSGFAFLSLIGYLVTEYGSRHPYQLGPSGFERLVACVPTTTLFLVSRMGSWDDADLFMVFEGVIVLSLAAIVISLVRSVPAWRTIRALEITAASLPPATTSSPDAAGSISAD